MPMRLSNDLFIQAMNYLITTKKVRDQQHLASVTGITESTLSRIMNDKVQKPSPVTIQKLLQAFPGIFNPLYLQGRSSYLLMSDYQAAVANHEPDIVPIDANQNKNIPESDISAADNMLELYARMIRGVDDLRVQLHVELQEVQQLRTSLQKTVAALTTELHRLQYATPHSYGMAAEELSNQ